jgi:hypothetical protein
MSKFRIKSDKPISRNEVLSKVDEYDVNHDQATDNAIPFRIGINWYWSTFSVGQLTGFEYYGFNDPEELVKLANDLGIQLIPIK